MELDTDNKFMVGRQGSNVVLMRSPGQRLTQEDALNLAAWMVAVTGERERFIKLLDDIEDV